MAASTLIVIFLIVGLIVVGLIGLIIWSIKRDQRRGRDMEQTSALFEQDELEAPDIQIEKSAPQITPEIKVVPQLQPQHASLLSIDRDWDNIWNIKVKGQRIRSLVDVKDATVRKNVMEAIKTLVGLTPSYEQEGSLEATKPISAPAVKPPVIDQLYPPMQRAGIQTGSIDLAKEIGEIVGRLLKADPVLRNHSVKVQNVPSGGIQFVLNGQTYQEIDDIPNEGVKAIIHNATQEWNRR